MSIIQFWRMLWARRFIVVVTLVCSLIGAFLVVLLAPPRYEAEAKVMLNLLRPDPITGDTVNPRAITAYVGTQIETLKGDEVTGQVAEDLGWTTDPGYISQYGRRSKDDTRDFRRWLAAHAADNLNAKLVDGSVLDITFDSPSAVEARNGAQSARQAFLDVQLAQRRQEAAKQANWYNQQAELARQEAEKAQAAKAAYERQTGIVLGSDQNDLESEQLRALAAAAAAPPPAVAQAQSSAAAQLAALDGQIAVLSANLGPNHPQMQELRARRAALAQAAARESAAGQGLAGAAAARTGSAGRALEQAKNQVIAQRDEVEKLRQLSGEVDLRRAQYTRTAAKAAEFNLEAAASDTGMRPLGVVVTPGQPIFPNKLLVFGGAAGLGLGLGVVLAILVELIRRHVRGPEDLEGGVEVPMLAIVDMSTGAAKPRRPKLGAGGKVRSKVKAA